MRVLSKLSVLGAAILIIPVIPLCVTAQGGTIVENWPKPEPIKNDNTEASKVATAKLDKIILPHINFERLDITALVEFLNEASKEQDPTHAGVKFRLDMPAKLANPNAIHREVSISLTDVPISELLVYPTQQTNLEYRIEKGVVVFSPHVAPKK